MGAEVALTYKSRRDAADAVVNDITTAGGRALAFEVDVVRSNSVDTLLRNVVDRCGRIDVLVNSAGIAPYRPLGAIDTDHVRDVLDANVLGAVLLTQAVVPYLPSPGGRIITFSSRLAVSPIATSSVYAAAKAAVSTLTLAFSKELGPKEITIQRCGARRDRDGHDHGNHLRARDAIKKCDAARSYRRARRYRRNCRLSCLAGVGLDHRTGRSWRMEA